MLDTCTAQVHAHGHFRARRMSCFFDPASGPGFRLDEALGFVTRWALTSVGGAVCLGMLAESPPRLRPLIQTLGVLAMLLSWCWVFLGVGILRDADPLPFQLPAVFVVVASYLAVTSEEALIAPLCVRAFLGKSGRAGHG